MASTVTEQMIIAALMQNPKLVLKKDKYPLRYQDFDNRLYRMIFWAIEKMAPGAQGALNPIEVEQMMIASPSAKAILNSMSGKQTLIDLTSKEMTISSYDSFYNKFKRENLIKDLKAMGYDTSNILSEDPIDDKDYQINEKYAVSTAQDIIEEIDHTFTDLKRRYIINDKSESQTLFEGMEEMIASLAITPEVGLPLQGDLFNAAISGALRGKFYLRSGSSGLGKTRQAVGDACYLAFPMRYEWSKRQWVKTGNCEKVLIVITEQDFDEVRKMALSYLTGINEGEIKRNLLSEAQRKVIAEAICVMREFESNFYIERVPAPTITIVKQIIKEQVEVHHIDYVFYDYIFISPSLLGEFKGMALRNDEILLMFSDALKQIAVELDVFVMSSTQVNSKADDNNDIRNEASLAGSRAVINKADMGCIMARPSKDELKTLESITSLTGIPNVVTDIYKNRGAESTQIRIWSIIDLGTMRKQDLFVTDSSMNEVDIPFENFNYDLTEEAEEQIEKVFEEMKGVDK